MQYKNIFNKAGDIIRTPLYDGALSDADCKSRFIERMNTKASALGMTGTTFTTPSGLDRTTNFSTAQDLLKLGIAACGYTEALKIWHTPSRSFQVYGENARTINVSNNMITNIMTDLGQYYRFLGGKGGSYDASGYYYRAQILLVEVENLPVMLATISYGQPSFTNMYKACKELADMVKDVIDGQTPTEGEYLATLIADGGGYSACVVPQIPTAYDLGITSAEFVARNGAVKNGETIVLVPASTTKTMTMLCALDNIKDMDATITIKSADIESGSGTTFYAGDTFKIGDALRIMMMESSNTLAQAIGRSIGGYLLQRG